MTDKDLEIHFERAKKLTRLLDTEFKIFGIRFGIDPILNIIPGVGSVIGAITSLYLFWLAYRLNVPSQTFLKMLWNLLIDFILGEVPLIGIIFDALYRANVKNLKLLEKFYEPEILQGEVM